MVPVHVGVWIHVTLVLSVLGTKVMTQDSSQTIAPSSEYTMSLSSRTSSTAIAIGMSTPTLTSRSTSALVTSLPVVTNSILVGHGTVSSSVHTIQPTATLSDIGTVKVASISGITSAVSTGHLVLTSSMSYGGVATSVPSVSVQATLGTTASVTIAGSSQVLSSLSASPVSVSHVPSVGSMVRASSLTSQNVPNTQVTTLLDRHSTALFTSPLPASTRIVYETLSSFPLFTSGSFQASTVRSELASSSLPPSLSSLVMPSLVSSVSPSSSLPPSTSAVIVSGDISSLRNVTVVKTIPESVTPTQATSVTSSVPFSSRTFDNMSISPTILAQVQSSVSHMTSVVSSLLPSSSSHEAFNIHTTRTIPETVLTPSNHVITMQTKSEVLSTPIIPSLDSYQSHLMQSVRSEQAMSSSVGQMTHATSLQETVIPTATSDQSVIMTSTTIYEIVVAPSSSVQRPSTSVLPEPFSTLEPSASSSHVELSTPVVATPRSSLPDHSTAQSPEHSITLPTLIARNISFEIEFKGVCNPLVQRKIVLEIFWEELVVTIANTLHIDKTVIKPKDIACRPIRISFVIMETMLANVTQTLKTLVASGAFKFKIPVLVGGSESKYQYEAVSVKQVPLNYDIAGTPDLYEIGLNKVDIIVIIVACCVSFILICIGCCICLREYYIRKRSRSFDLSDIVNFNLKLEDYTLTKIPRNKPFYSDNAVKMQSFTRKNGQQTKSLLEQEENCNCDDVNVMKEVKVRMNSHSDGIVIGVTATSIPDVVTNHQTPHDDQTDQSKEILFENESSPTHCMDNPIYFADDDRFTAV